MLFSKKLKKNDKEKEKENTNESDTSENNWIRINIDGSEENLNELSENPIPMKKLS